MDFPARKRLAVLGALVVALLAAAPAGAAPTWLPPTSISGHTRKAYKPQIAINAAGEAVAVWSRSIGESAVIQSASRPPRGPWSAPTTISVKTRRSFEPQVAINAAGEAVAIWRSTDGKHPTVQSASRPPGGTWPTPTNLSTGGHGNSNPQIALDDAGEAVAVWELSDGVIFIVRGASRSPGGTWSAPTDLSIREWSGFEPQVVIAPGGEAVAVWAHNNGMTFVIQSASRLPGRNWSAPAAISVKTQLAAEPQIAVDAGGEAVAVWESFSHSGEAIQSASHPPGGTWSAPARLSAKKKDEPSQPRIAIEAGGEAVAVWEIYDDDGSFIQSASRPAGGTWSAPAVLTEKGQGVENPQIAIDTAHEAVAVWERFKGRDGDIVQSAARSPAGAWSAPTTISGKGTGFFDSRVVMGAAGEAMAIWRRTDGESVIESVSRP
jgi:hypothetical protein